MNDIKKFKKIINLLSGYSGALVGGFVVFFFIPQIKSNISDLTWATFIFCNSIIAFSAIADCGISQVLQKDLALSNRLNKEDLIFLKYIDCYLVLSTFAGLFTYLLLNFIVNDWFSDIRANEQINAVSDIVSAIVFICVLNICNQTYWLGTGKILAANTITSTSYFLKFLLIFLISDKYTKLQTIFYLIFFISAIEFYIQYIYIKNKGKNNLNCEGRIKFVWSKFRENKKLSAASIIGYFNSNCDKLILPKFFTLEVYSAYTFTMTLVSALMQLQYPALKMYTSRIFKELSINSNSQSSIQKEFKIILIITFYLPILICLIYSRDILDFWYKYNFYSEQILVMFRLSLFGVILNSIFNIINIKIIFYEKYKQLLILNLIIFFLSIIALPLMVLIIGGPLSGGIFWVLIYGFQAAGGLFILSRGFK